MAVLRSLPMLRIDRAAIQAGRAVPFGGREAFRIRREGLQIGRAGFQIRRERFQISRNGLQIAREVFQTGRSRLQIAQARFRIDVFPERTTLP